MFRTILISVLSAILVVALGAGVYYTISHSENVLAASETSPSATSPQRNPALAQPAHPEWGAAAPNAAPNSLDAPAGQAFGQGNSGGRGNRFGANRGGASNPANGQNIPNPQADLSQAVTVQGVVVKYEYGTLTLQPESGELVAIQLGNQNYLNQLNFIPVSGETLRVVAFPGEQGLLTAVSITRLSDGTVYQLRDSTIGRPLWAGGRNRRGGGQP